MANRFVLNETSYHGKGAIDEIPNEAKARGFKKALVCSDPDLIKFNVTKKVTDLLDEAGLAYEIFSDKVLLFDVDFFNPKESKKSKKTHLPVVKNGKYYGFISKEVALESYRTKLKSMTID